MYICPIGKNNASVLKRKFDDVIVSGSLNVTISVTLWQLTTDNELKNFLSK